MVGLFQWTKLSQMGARVETGTGTEMGAGTDTETGVVIGIEVGIVITEVGEDLVGETASNVASLVILPENVHRERGPERVVDMEVGMIDTEVVAAADMGLIVMGIAMVGAAAGILVVVEMIDIAVRVHMSALELEVFVLDEVIIIFSAVAVEFLCDNAAASGRVCRIDVLSFNIILDVEIFSSPLRLLDLSRLCALLTIFSCLSSLNSKLHLVSI